MEVVDICCCQQLRLLHTVVPDALIAVGGVEWIRSRTSEDRSKRSKKGHASAYAYDGIGMAGMEELLTLLFNALLLVFV